MPNGAYAQRERTRLRHSSQERSALHVYSRDLMCVACLMLLDSRDRFAQIAHALAHIDAQACLQPTDNETDLGEEVTYILADSLVVLEVDGAQRRHCAQGARLV